MATVLYSMDTWLQLFFFKSHKIITNARSFTGQAHIREVLNKMPNWINVFLSDKNTDSDSNVE